VHEGNFYMKGKIEEITKPESCDRNKLPWLRLSNLKSSPGGKNYSETWKMVTLPAVEGEMGI